MMTVEWKGIDVSKHNGTIDWKKVKAEGVQFAIIRACYGWDNDEQIDRRLTANVEGCEANGIPYGFYHYSYATTVEEARREALFFSKVISGYRPSMPVVYDLEDSSQARLSKSVLTDMALAFCQTMEGLGYYAMLYANLDWVRNRLDMDRLRGIDLWLAHWTDKTSYTDPFGMWQYSSSGKVDGVSGNVDMNIAYMDYPAIIKKANLNGWGSEQTGGDEISNTVPLEKYQALQSKYKELVAGIAQLCQKYGGEY